LFVI
jgi:hypothetical protein